MKHWAWCLAHRPRPARGGVSMTSVSQEEPVCQTGASAVVCPGGSGLRQHFRVLSHSANRLSLALGSWAYREIAFVIYLCLLKYFWSTPQSPQVSLKLLKRRKFFISWKKRTATFVMVPRRVRIKAIRTLWSSISYLCHFMTCWLFLTNWHVTASVGLKRNKLLFIIHDAKKDLERTDNESGINEKQESTGNNVCHWVSTGLFSFSNMILGCCLKQEGP